MRAIAVKRVLGAMVVVLGLAIPVSACGTTTASNGAVTAVPLPAIAADVLGARGQIVTSARMADRSPTLLAAGVGAFTMVYRTASGVDGTAREVSGTVFVPPGPAPAGGWPIITYGHGTTGITPDCGPSRYPDLLGYDQVLVSLVKLGFLVTMTDYEGLGHPGHHPYLEPKTAAFNLIDAVRAAKNLTGDASKKWFAVGVSQGGQAAWAANEFAAGYGNGLDFRGSASLSPATDLSGTAALSQADWLTPAQQVVLPMLLIGLTATHPDLEPGDYLHGPLATDTAIWLACTAPDIAKRANLASTLTGHDSEPVSDGAATSLAHALADMAVPQRPASGPMLVVTGDADQIVRLAWVQKSVRKACAMGDTVQFIVDPGAGHGDPNGGGHIGEWLLDRLAGKQAPNTC